VIIELEDELLAGVGFLDALILDDAAGLTFLESDPFLGPAYFLSSISIDTDSFFFSFEVSSENCLSYSYLQSY
jgi:hypothetical protein